MKKKFSDFFSNEEPEKKEEYVKQYPTDDSVKMPSKEHLNIEYLKSQVEDYKPGGYQGTNDEKHQILSQYGDWDFTKEEMIAFMREQNRLPK